MRQIPLFEVKNKLSFFIHLVEQGERIEITRHGKSVAAIVSSDEDAQNSNQNIKNPFYLAYLDMHKKLKELHFSETDWEETFNIPRIKTTTRHPEDFE